MNRILTSIVLVLTIIGCSDKNEVPVIKSLLVQQLKNTYDDQEWFVPTKKAINGLTVAQWNWRDSTENHSIGELVSHLIFWNEMNLKAFNGENVPNFNDDNEVTFVKNGKNDLKTAIRMLDSIQTQWKRSIESATDEQPEDWSTEIANMGTHNAYHTGQIIYIRNSMVGGIDLAYETPETTET